ncbi:hypothetical protein NBRGN_041_00090 [Nocardia brasiliensis NBRC 14402]|uniref:hypothetical protein n=1 Tax=Nocardia brasiliensis TaxID=37326 RepID=UPI00045C96DD|nr:hypothetical protein [Nocardia brasiliensis]ASF09301.1 hypothetical protein CEQ30_20240 [Nocardia brasiliensis]GAJ81661.1 hypothetical protein NBRGN_041_00090 [Nocardia brasiliensis NBRC 14402]
MGGEVYGGGWGFGGTARRFGGAAECGIQDETTAGGDAGAEVGAGQCFQGGGAGCADGDAAEWFADDLVDPGEGAGAVEAPGAFSAVDLGEHRSTQQDEGAVVGGRDHAEVLRFGGAGENHGRETLGQGRAGTVELGDRLDRAENSLGGNGFTRQIDDNATEARDQAVARRDTHGGRFAAHPRPPSRRTTDFRSQHRA